MSAGAESSAYLVGRTMAALKAPWEHADKSFGADRMDDQVIEGGKFRHCTFANVSFKKAFFRSSQFEDCIFIGCYFRRAELSGTSFVGCRFMDCNFTQVVIKSCEFKHSSFRGCQLSFSELRHSLPSEPNLREDLARNLAIESSQLGLSGEARQYRMAEIRAREEHLRAAMWGESQWYLEHFVGSARFKAAGQLVLSRVNGFVWGYGERMRILVRTVFLLAFLFFPVGFWLFSDQLSSVAGAPIGIRDVLYFSLQNMTPAGVNSGISAVGPAARLLAAIEAVFGVIAMGLFASHVFRWSLHR